MALHVADVADNNGISILSEMANNLSVGTQSFLPGIDNHPCLVSFIKEGFRWYICSCGIPNCVGNCGEPTPASICIGCRVALSAVDHQPRNGVRRATAADFQPPKGFATHRTPSTAPAFTTREMAPVVTRFCLLLDALVMMKAALRPAASPPVIAHFLNTLPVTDRPNHGGDRRALIQLLSQHIVVHLDLLNQLLMRTGQRLTWPDKFRVGHLLIHKLLEHQNAGLTTPARDYAISPRPRELFENALAGLLTQQRNLEEELKRTVDQVQGATKQFRQSIASSETTFWGYARRNFSDRRSVQLELARDGRLGNRYPFLGLLLDDDNWAPKMDALQHLGDAMRFAALARSVLQGAVTVEEANLMTIRQALDKIVNAVKNKAVLLDRGRAISSGAQVEQLFGAFKSLWDRFSQIPNAENKTFLDFIECQQVDVRVRPNTILQLDAPMILILTGSDLPETT